MVSEIKNTDMLLFFGICGALKGNKDRIYFPTEFRELYFIKSYISEEEIKKARLKNAINSENILYKSNHKKVRVITTNIALNLNNTENQRRELLLKLVNKLKKREI